MRLGLLLLALVHALTLTSVAEEYSTKLPKNMSVVVPMSSAAWRDGIARTKKLLGGKVRAVAILCREADTPALGPIANTLANPLGGNTPGALDPRCTTGRVLCVDKTSQTLRWVVDGQVQLTLAALL